MDKVIKKIVMDDWLYAKLNKCNGCGSDVKLDISFVFLIIFAFGDILSYYDIKFFTRPSIDREYKDKSMWMSSFIKVDLNTNQEVKKNKLWKWAGLL